MFSRIKKLNIGGSVGVHDLYYLHWKIHRVFVVLHW